MLDQAAAEGVVAALDLDLNRMFLCPMCLFGVSYELRRDNERALRRALREFAPLLWDEGLEAPLKASLERARVAGVDRAAEAIADVERRGWRSAVVEAAVVRLARQQAEEARRASIISRN